MKKVSFIFVLFLVFFTGCAQKCDWEGHELLIERNHVIDRVNALFIATDNRDWASVKACFSDSVLFDMSSMGGGEPSTISSQSIVDAWDEGLKALKAIHHQAGNYVVKINGNEADVFCYAIATHFLPNKTNKNVRTFVGSYDLHLRVENQHWRINKFKYNLKYIDGNPDLEKS